MSPDDTKRRAKIRLREVDSGFLAYSVVACDEGEIEWFLGTALRIRKPYPRWSCDFRPASPALFTDRGEILLSPLDVTRWFAAKAAALAEEIES